MSSSTQPLPSFIPQATNAQQGTFAGLPAVQLRHADGSSAVVLLYGAHVVSWVDAQGREQLYLSPRSKFQPGTAVRGGIPVIFPQFSTQGPLPRHGLARTSDWELIQLDAGTVHFVFTSNADTLALWPHAFTCELRVELQAGGLDVQLTVLNRGATAFSFAAALHTYLAVPAFEGATLQGLQGCHFTDEHSAQRQQEDASKIRFAGPLDRVYYDVPGPLALQSNEVKLHVSQQGFTDAVVWNPGPEGVAQTSDFAPHAHEQFVCVEAAAIGRQPTLEPGTQWQGSQHLRSFYSA